MARVVDSAAGDAVPAGKVLPPIDAANGAPTVPDAQLLFGATYTRVGDDLHLTGADGTSQVIANYFALDAAPVLFSPDGAIMAPHLVATLVAAQTPRQFAQAGPIDTERPIGEVQDVVGTASVIRDGVPVALAAGDPVFQNDVVQTGLGAELVIGFADGTIFTLSSGARITLDGMIYDPAGGDNSLVLSVVQGTFSFVTGQIAPSGEMLVNTPVATIGIRGTICWCRLVSPQGPVGCIVSKDDGSPTDSVTYEDPLTGLVIANLINPAGVYEIASLGVPPVERPASGQERIEFNTQSNALRNAQANIQLNIDVQQPIFQPDSRSDQRGDAGDDADSGAPLQTGAGPQAQPGQPGEAAQAAQGGGEDGAPIETAAGPDPGPGPGPDGSGGLGGVDEPEFVETEQPEPAPVTSNTPTAPTTSPPPAGSGASVPPPVQTQQALAPTNQSGPRAPTAAAAPPPPAPAPPQADAPPPPPPSNVSPVVSNVNLAPVEDAQGTPLGLGAPSDADGDPLTIAVTGLPDPAKGAVTLANGAAVQVNDVLSPAELTGLVFNTVPNAEGPAGQFRYSVFDGTVTVQGAATIAIVGVDDGPPVAVDDFGNRTPEDTAVTIDVLGNDRDPDGQGLTVVSTGIRPGNVAQGSTVINPDGTITFTPNADFAGPASFTYTVEDIDGQRDTADVEVLPVNDPPVVDSRAVTFDEDSQDNALGLAAPTDADGDPLMITVTGLPDPAKGTVTLVNGTAVQISDVLSAAELTGLLFNTVPDAEGPTGQFTYEVDDGTAPSVPGTVDISITPINDPPVARGDTVATNEDTPLPFDARADQGNGADSDVDGDALTVSAVNGNPLALGQAVNLPSGAILTLNLDGSFTYDPNGQFEALNTGDTGNDGFDYTIGDGQGGFDSARVSLIIDGVTDVIPNQDPVAANDTVLANEDRPLIFDARADHGAGPDSDPDDDALSVSAVNGTPLALGGAVNLPSGALLTLNLDGSFTYDPNGRFDNLNNGDIGNDSFDYTVADGNGGTDDATVTIDIDGVNDAPAVDIDLELPGRDLNRNYTEGDPSLFVAGFGGVRDPDDQDIVSLTVTLSPRPDGAAETLRLDPAVAAAQGIAVAGDGSDVISLTGTASRGAYATVLRTIVYENASDDPTPGDRLIQFRADDGADLGPVSTLTVTVAQLNDPPVADSRAVTFDEDSQDNALGLAAPTDADGDPLTITVTGLPDPTKGTVTLVNGTAVQISDVLSAAELTGLLFNTVPDAEGPTGQFTYDVDDGTAPSVPGTVDIDITPINDPPVARGDTVATDEDTPLPFDARADQGNGADSDVDGDALTVSAVNGNALALGQAVNLPSGAILTLNLDGSFTYDPNGQFEALNTGDTGNDSFDYTVADGNGGTDDATVTIDIDGVNDAPVVDLNPAAPGIDFSTVFSEGDDPVPVAPDATITDVDGTTLASIDIVLTGALDGTSELLSGPGFRAGASLAEFEQVLRSMTYRNTSENPTPGVRRIEVVADDGSASNNLSLLAVTSIEVRPVNDAPILENNNLVVTEGLVTPLGFGNLLAVDPDTAPENIRFDITDISGGRFFLTTVLVDSVTSFTQAQINAGDVNFQHDGGEDEPTYSVSVTDGATPPSAPAAAAIVFNPVNDAPEIDLNGLDGAVFTEQLAPAVVDANLTISDPDSATLSGASVTILNLQQPGAEFLSPGEFSSPDIAVDFNPQTGVLTLLGEAPLAVYQQALRSVIYFNNSDDPTLGGTLTQRTIGFTVNDSATASLAALATVDLAAVNDPPVNTVPGAQDTALATGLRFSDGNGNAISIADPDAGANAIQVTLSVTDGTLTLVNAGGLAVGEGTATVVLTGALAAINAALAAGVTYSSTLAVPGTDTLTVATDDLGNTGAGGALQDVDQVAITVNDPNNDVILQGLSLTVGDTGTGAFSLSGGQSLLLSTAVLGNAAGGIGTLNVAGANTALNVTENTSLVVGAAGTGILNVTGGAAVTVGTAGSAAFMTIGAEATGVGTVTVNDASLSVNGSGGLAVGDAGRGTLRVENGALVEVTSNQFNSVDVGRAATGEGSVVVTGAGSVLRTLGTDNTVQVGRLGAGTLTVEAGARVETLHFGVGREGTGTATVTGQGTLVVASNDHGLFPGEFSGMAGFVRVGRRDGGDGTLNVLDGAKIVIRAGDAASGNADTANPGLTVAEAGSKGALRIEGTGSAIEISQTAPSDPDNDIFGPSVTVARGGTGEATIRAGGKLLLTGDNPDFKVGRFAGDVGSVLVEGDGSAVTLTGKDAFASIGREGLGHMTLTQGAALTLTGFGASLEVGRTSGAQGTLDILSGARVTLAGGDDFTRVRIGRDAGATGTVRVEGTSSQVALTGIDQRIDVGQSGSASLETRDGASVSASRLDIGSEPTGVGTALVDNARWTIGTNGLNVGREGGGTLDIQNGGTVEVNGTARIGWTGGSSGQVDVHSSGELDVIGSLSVGEGSFFDNGTPGNQTDDFGQNLPGFGLLNIFGGTVTTQGANLGGSTRGVGTVMVDGGGTWTSSAGISVSHQGKGSLAIWNGTVNANGVFNAIADTGGSSGTVTVHAGGQFNSGGFLVIGNGSFNINDPNDPNDDFGQDAPGVGLLDIDGGTVTSKGADLGQNIRGAGTVIVDGGGTWTDSGVPGNQFSGINVGQQGHGTLTILNGTVTASGPFNNIAHAGGSTGTVTVHNGGQFNVGGSLNIGIGNFNNNGTPNDSSDDFGRDAPSVGLLDISGGTVTSQGADIGGQVRGDGTVEIRHGGTWSDSGNFLNVGPQGQGAIEVGHGTLNVNSLGVGVGTGTGTLTIANGGTVNADNFSIGANGTLSAGKGTINLGNPAGTGTLVNAGTVVFGAGPGTLNIGGNYNQTGSELLLKLGLGGANVVVAGSASFAPGTTVRLQQQDTTRFGDAFALTAASALGIALGDVTIEAAPGFRVFPQVGGNTAGFTTIVDGTLEVTDLNIANSGIRQPNGAISVVGQTVLVTADIDTSGADPSSIAVDSALGQISRVAFNGNVTTSQIVVQGDGTSRAVINQQTNADFLFVNEGDAADAESIAVVGSPVILNLSGTAFVGDTGTGEAELLVYGIMSAADIVIGNQAGARGAMTVAGGVVDVTNTSTLIVGQQGTGVLNVIQGGQVQASGLVVGAAPTGDGTVTVDGDGSRMTLTGNINRLEIGNWGAGRLTVSGGGVVDGANPLNADPNFSNVFIGNAAGSTGELTITGLGSRLDALNAFVVGGLAVFTQANDGFDFGTPGGTTNATVLVEAGGVLNTQGGTIGGRPGPSALGTESVNAAVTVTGQGSQWNIGGGGSGSLSVGDTANGTGTLTVENGGSVGVDDVRVGGRTGAVGTITVDGGGSNISTSGPSAADPTIAVGRNGGTGSLIVSNGAAVRSLQLQAGRSSGDTLNDDPNVLPGNGSRGTVTITGAGSVVRLSNDFGMSGPPDQPQGARFRAGRNDGETGIVNVLDGARLELAAGPNKGNPYFEIARNPGSQGTLLVDNATVSLALTGPADPTDGGPGVHAGRAGAASVTIQNRAEVHIIGDGAFLGVSRGNTDEGGTDQRIAQSLLSVQAGGKLLIDSGTGPRLAFFGIGQRENADGKVIVDGSADLVNGRSEILVMGGVPGQDGAFIGVGMRGHGALEVLGGGRILLDGLDAATIGLAIGGTSGDPDGTGTVTVRGAGSEIDIVADTGFLNVGRNGTGTLTVDRGGAVRGATFMNVGHTLISSGTVVIDGTNDLAGFQSELVMSGFDVNNDAAFITVGREGNGTFDILGGARVSIDGESGVLPGMSVGGNENAVGGTGNVLIQGDGSELVIVGDTGLLHVGNNGAGALTVESGGTISGPTFMSFGRLAGSLGQGTVSGAQSSVTLSGSVSAAAAVAAAATIDVGQGPFLSVGIGGTGRLDIILGAQISIEGGTGEFPGFQAGRNVNADGTIVVDGPGSSIILRSARTDHRAGDIEIGRSGTGLLEVTNGGTVSNTATGFMVIGGNGPTTPGTGSVLVLGTATNVSTLDAGAFLLVGMDFDFATGAPQGPNTGGTGTLTIGAFGQVNAGQVFIGTDGTLDGSGSLNATATTLDGGTIAAGASAGTLTLGGDLIVESGALEVELGDLPAGEADLIDVSGAVDLRGAQIEFSLLAGYVPLAVGERIVFLSAADGVTIDSTKLSLAIAGVGGGVSSSDFSVTISSGNDLEFTANAPIAAGDRAFFFGSDLDDNYSGGDGDDVLFGGAGNDTFAGGQGNDDLRGGLGNDTIDGGSGIDTVFYNSAAFDNGAFKGVSINLASTAIGGVAPNTANDEFGTTDMVFNVENVIGSDQGDAIFGDEAPNRLVGNGGNDLLVGNAGADTFAFSLADNEGIDNVFDFAFDDGDRLAFEDVIDSNGTPGIQVDELVASFVGGAGPGAVDVITLTSGTIINVTDLNDAFNSLDDVFANSLVNGA